MKVLIDKYNLNIHQLDNKIILTVSSRIGTVKMKNISQKISLEKSVSYFINTLSTNNKFKNIKIEKKIGKYILIFKQNKEGILEIFYKPEQKQYKEAFVSRKRINGESLTISLLKEPQSIIL